ncbi:MAG: DUF3379 family protein [Pseudomonadota bacterium]|nr:DUF3379 family protein [Pseudomonadota bacterium]
MNCLEFRRAIAVQPKQLDATARAHRDECPRCAQAQISALRFEAVLDRGLAIPVPAEWADRILLGQTTMARQQSSGRRAVIWRIAAGLALTAGIASVSWLALAPQQSLAAISLQHLGHAEPMSLNAQGVVSGVALRESFERLGVKLLRSPGNFSYLKICPLGSRRSLHMVMQQRSGAVTVMYVPGERVARNDFAEHELLGREITVNGGALVMMAASRADFDAIEAGFRAAL